MSESLADQFATTALYGGNADFIEDLFARFLKDPQSVDPTWAQYFNKLSAGSAGEADHRQIRERMTKSVQRVGALAGAANPVSDIASAKQGAVSRLIQVYANRGHLIANLDPLGLQERATPYVLDIAYFGLSDADLDT